jgi:predicted ATPase/class 3 adenylate cyclase
MLQSSSCSNTPVTELPSGTVTFLFTDVEGSTHLLSELGDAYADVLHDHRRILREAFARHGGVEVDTQGDAFFVAFPRAADALAAARDATEALDGPVRVRIGVHTGEPLVTEEGYVGIDVHRAARIAAAGHGGQILVSQSTRDLVGGDGLRDLGEHRLKDLTSPERIYQFGDGDFPPLKTLYETNLPVQPTPLVGRERELAEILELLRSSRLLTLTGAGGSGKTRLAIQAAAEATDNFRDGVWFVSLASLRDAELVSPTIAASVDGGGDLLDYLRPKKLLLLLDNMEQLLPDAASQVDALLAAPGITVLVTSRERVGISAEQEYPVPTLALEEGAMLFVQRARQLRPAFQPDRHVDDVVVRLDGLPLAIELAAARVKVLTPKQIAERLGRSLDLLKGGGADLPERQRTLRATIEWSHELLGDEERRLFARLAVFGGSFELETAERVCDADLDAVGSLVDKSLLRETADGRFFMLETIREFALRLFEDLPDAVELQRRHAAFFVALGSDLQPELEGAQDESRALDRLERELPNIRAALTFLRDEDPDSELVLVSTASEMFRLHGHAVEGRAWLEDALGRTDRNHPARPDGLEKVAYLAYQCRDLDAAEAYVEELQELADAICNDGAKGRALHVAAIVAISRGDTAAATALEEEAVGLLAGDGYEPFAHTNLTYLALLQDDTASARTHARRAMECGGASHEHAAGPLALLALAELIDGDDVEAARLMSENVRHEKALGFTPYFALQSIPLVAAIAAARMQWSTSAELLGAVDAYLDGTGSRLGPLFQRLYDSTLWTLQERSGEERIEAQRTGRDLSFEDIYALAVEQADVARQSR